MDQTTIKIDSLCVNAIRVLAAEAVEAAKSGHPGAPMGIAPMAYVLWKNHLNVNPERPDWENRDRFILSAGHASMLQYALLHLSGFDVSMEDIKQFRQWGSKTPGHPEHGMTPGVETTTGPLGQGVANAVGMAMAEKQLSARYNRSNASIVDHFTYVIASDGDLMEGVSYEACSLAGHFGLGKLICLYDSNQITIDGSTDLTYTENTRMRFESMGWHVLEVENGDDDLEGINRAIEAAKNETSKPSLIIVTTTIGYGSPNKSNKASSHGAPLGEDEIQQVKKFLEWPQSESFSVPAEVTEHFKTIKERGQAAAEEWDESFENYKKQHPDLAKQWKAEQAGQFSQSLEHDDFWYAPDHKPVATRSASGEVLNRLSGIVADLVSGCADLSGSVMTALKNSDSFEHNNPTGRNIHYGVREHAMGSIANGLMLHGGVRPAVGTFLIFSDYMKPPIRLAALMGLPVIYMFSHDSISLGEDGPTHQPVEQLLGLRAVPGLTVFRPADANETAAAWIEAVKNTAGPTAIVTSRQNLPVLAGGKALHQKVSKGAYVLVEASDSKKIDLILIATGSEVHLASEAQKKLAAEGLSVRLVSMPSWELFDSQSDEYRESVLPSDIENRISIEAAGSLGWEKYVGLKGHIIGLRRFGASAPGPVVAEKLGFNLENILSTARKLTA